MDDKSLSIKQNMMWNSFGNLVYLLGQWMTTIIVVKISGYENAGILSVAMSIATTFAAVARFGMRNYQVSDVALIFTDSEYVISRYITSLIALILCVTFVIVSPYSVIESRCIIYYMIFKIIEALVDVYHGIYQKSGRMDTIGKSFVLKGMAIIICFTVSLILVDELSIAIFIMVVAMLGLFIVYDIQQLRKIYGIKIAFDNIGKTWKLLYICMPLAIYSLLINLVPTIPKLFFENIYGAYDLGIYATIATPVVIVQVAATFVFTPLVKPLTDAYVDGDVKQFQDLVMKCIYSIVAIGCCAIVASIVMGEFALGLVFGSEVTTYTYLLPFIVVAILLTAIVWFFATVLTIIRKLKIVLVANLLATIVCLMVSWPVVMHYNMQGISIATVISLIVSILLQGNCLMSFIKKGFNDEK